MSSNVWEETVVNLRVGSRKVLLSLSEDRAFTRDEEIGMAFAPEMAHLFAVLTYRRTHQAGKKDTARSPMEYVFAEKRALLNSVRPNNFDNVVQTHPSPVAGRQQVDLIERIDDLKGFTFPRTSSHTNIPALARKN